MPLVGVIGATGRQGLAQIKQLKRAGYDVRAFSRRRTPSFFDIKGHVESVVLDLEDEATILPALDGCDVVFHTHPLKLKSDRVTSTLKIAAACKAVGVSRIIHNTSSWIPDKPGDPHSYHSNTACIQALWASGVPSTVFGAVLYMDNFLTDWARPYLVKERRYIYPHHPEVGANWMSLDDVGKIMVASIERSDMAGSWMNIGGPERLRGPEVANILSQALGFEIAYDPCTEEEFGDLLVAAMGNEISEKQREAFSRSIADSYKFFNTSPTKPFSINFSHVKDRFPEIEFETLLDWAKRQDWSDSQDRPSAG